jgi:ElaB/YqjD/DUF883 family membrane-anchored ribosome-binding protein
MRDEVLDGITDVRAAAARLGAGVDRVKDAVADAVDDGIGAAKRAIKHGRRAAADLVDDGAHQVKRHPASALGIAFGIGVGVGAVIGMLLAHDRRGGR